MKYYNEAKLDSELINRLKKKGINKVVDNVEGLSGSNAIIELTNTSYKNDADCISNLIEVCSKLTNYDSKVIYIPLYKWYRDDISIETSKNALGAIVRNMKNSPVSFKKNFADFAFIFYNATGENFVLYVNEYKTSEYKTVIKLMSELVSNTANIKRPYDTDSKNTVKDVAKIDEKKDKKLDEKKQDLVDAVSAAVEDSTSEEEVWDKMNNDEFIKELIVELEEDDDGAPKFNSTRTSRIAKLNDEFLNREIKGKTVKDIISNKDTEMPSKHLKVSSINEEWDDLKFVNFQDVYDIDEDILKILQCLSSKSYPISILDISIEDTSTNQDYVNTYTIQTEDGYGKRSTLVIDVPKFKNKRFMKLRGNEKVLSGQLVLLPCLKTDEDTVQCVSNYNKIFIRRHGLSGRSYPSSDRLLKSLRKLDKNNKVKVYYGDNSAICSKYELPIDYIDLACEINRIETPDTTYYFNQDIYYTKFNADIAKGIPYAIYKSDNSIRYYNDGSILISSIIAEELLALSEDLHNIYEKVKPANRLNYSEVSILSNKIPLAVVIGHSIGMTKMITMCTGKAPEFLDKRTSYDPDRTGIIKFSDGYIKYDLNYSTSMLLNGLSECPTNLYSLSDINKKSMWLDFLDEFGGRILADGLDNFADLFIDPITEEVCSHCGIPSDYFSLLIYANNLLADNKYNRHTDISGNRYRSNEIVAGYFYKAITKAYTDYKIQVKRGRKVGISIKRSAVIDGILQDPMSADLSILNPLLEVETSNSVSFKGLSGMNSTRSYGLDKRTYDDSMINKLALSTGFAENVGINRQTTIDMDIEGKRGYIKKSNNDDISVTKTLSMSEAVTPFGTTRDDPFRSAMTFVQTAKHSMRTKKSMPLLITNGADEAMAYVSSDTFSYKAKEDGTVIDFAENKYMVIKYTKSGLCEYIDLSEQVKKNSDGGFFITLQLTTDLKQDSKFKKDQIIAWDETSFSNKNGESDNLAYNIGVLAKVAILNTDEGFEDSTAVSEWLSEAMTTDVITEKEKDLSKNTNIYSIVKVGQEVQEGDTLMLFQNSFDEKDANLLLKNITDPEYVSDLGKIKFKSKYTGVVQDIKIYRTCELDDMSDSLKKIVVDYENGIKAKKKFYKKYSIPGANTIEPDYKMEPTGIMKNNPDGVKFVFYIKYNDKLSIGDKTVAQSANKGVVKNIFPSGLEPFSEFRPEEHIHALYAARSFNARMVTSVWVSGGINKCMIELDRAVKDIMGIDVPKLEDVE